jgi:hypothetical protein
MKFIRSIVMVLSAAGYMVTGSIAGNLLHGPTLEKTGVSSTEGSIVVYREENGDTGSTPAIFIDGDIVGSLLPGEFSQTKVCADAIKLRVATRGSVVSAGQSQKVQIHKRENHLCEDYSNSQSYIQSASRK